MHLDYGLSTDTVSRISSVFSRWHHEAICLAEKEKHDETLAPSCLIPVWTQTDAPRLFSETWPRHQALSPFLLAMIRHSCRRSMDPWQHNTPICRSVRPLPRRPPWKWWPGMDPWTDRSPMGRGGRATTHQRSFSWMRSRKPRCSPGPASPSPRCRPRKRFNHCDRPPAAVLQAAASRPGTPPVQPRQAPRSTGRNSPPPQCFRAGHVLRCLPIRPSIHPSIHPSLDLPPPRLRTWIRHASALGRPAVAVLGQGQQRE